jgi:hypothetical protein
MFKRGDLIKLRTGYAEYSCPCRIFKTAAAFKGGFAEHKTVVWGKLENLVAEVLEVNPYDSNAMLTWFPEIRMYCHIAPHHWVYCNT